MNPSDPENNSERNNNQLGYTSETSDSTQKVCRICYGGEAKIIIREFTNPKDQSCVPRRT